MYVESNGPTDMTSTPLPHASGQTMTSTPRKSRWWIAAVAVVVLLALLGSCCVVPFMFSALSLFRDGDVYYTDGVAVIHVDAVIAGVGGEDLFGMSIISPEYLIALLRAADEDPGISVVLLRIDSPGGTVAASQEIATEVARMEKPVVASVGDVGASGAYWVASQCDHIVANPGSSVGSIGVILEIPNYEGLMDLVGVETTVITRGEFKDAGSPYRDLTAQESALFGQSMDVVYEQFIGGVAEGRGMEVAEVEELATGWAWPGSVALDLGLVDSLGNYMDAVEVAAEFGGIEGEPEIVYYDEPDPWELFYSLMGVVERLGKVGEVLSWTGRGVPVPR